jgi:2-polyprenyl-6-methoxyphenol hydroxylase-like FAD-dependent oxidoreductase
MTVTTRCCVAGGGPAGMMLGLLLGRAGVDVLVLEKHADFLRDFRGDTIHPSTLRVMDELGILDDLLKLPHQKVQRLRAQVGGATVEIADFTHLPPRYAFIAMMPQWDFLDFLAGRAARSPSFALRRSTEATDLIEEAGRIVGVRASGPDGPLEVRADLVVGADGRHSTVRERAGLHVDEFGAPMDVLWFRLSRKPRDPADTMGRFDPGRLFVMINRGEHWQLGYVISKGSIDEIQRQGLPRFRETVAALASWTRDRVDEIRTWGDVKLLTVGVDRLRQWYRPGLLCIGDAAHTMSPVGGVGINLAIQDAVATANILAAPLRERSLTVDHLRRVQRRREFPTRVTQAMQVAVQRRIITRVLAGGDKPLPLPLLLRLLVRFPILRRIPARLVGIGVRPEHVRTPELETTGSPR